MKSTIAAIAAVALALAATQCQAWLRPDLSVGSTRLARLRRPIPTRSVVLASGAHADEDADVVEAEVVGPTDISQKGIELGEKLRGVAVYFVGMMGSGKSATGDLFAKALGRYSFIDTDKTIELLSNATITEVFAELGEEGFRELETQVLNEIKAYVRVVVSTGGGIVLRNNNWAHLQNGIVVWLDVAPPELARRLEADQAASPSRPLLDDGTDRPIIEKVNDILNVRRSRYELADIHVELDGSEALDDTVIKVIDGIEEFMENNPPKWKQWQARARNQGIDYA